MAGVFCFCSDQQAVVARSRSICDVRNVDELVVQVWSIERCSTRSATEEISVGSADTSRWRIDIHVQPIEQNVRASSSCIPSSQNDVSGQLTFDVQVELLHHPLFEIQVLRQRGSGKVIGVGGCSKRLKIRLREAIFQPAVYSVRTRSKIAEWARITDVAETKLVNFSVIRRILPKPLRSLAPTGVVVYRIASANHCVLYTEWLPGQPNPRFECGFIEFNPHISVRSYAVWVGLERCVSSN